MKNSLYHSKIKTLILAGLMTGTLDILCAIVILAKGNAVGTLRFIAKGAFGITAYTDGYKMVFAGLIIHYIIAFAFATGYFFIFPYIPFLNKQRILSGILYGLFVWALMQYMMLPLTHNPPGPFMISTSWKQVLILIGAIGLPVSFITAKYYRYKQAPQG